MENKYQRGKIYKIISNHTDKIYIGSTTEPTLARRLTGHTQNYKCYPAGKQCYISSFELLQYPDYKIVLIESYPCNSKDELLSREQHHIDLAGDNCVNRQKAFTGLTEQEYFKQRYVQNRAIVINRTKHYYAQNKEKIIETQNQKIMCDCGTLFSKRNKARHEKTFIHTEYLKMLA